MCKKIPVSGPFNGKVQFIPFPFMIHSLYAHDLFEVHVHFPSVSKTFYIHSMFEKQLLHVAVYDFYGLLKGVHAGQQFACSRRKIAIVLLLRYGES